MIAASRTSEPRTSPRQAAACREKIVDPRPRFYYGDPGAEGHQPAALRPQGHRLHRPVRLRQVDAAARAQPHVRPLPRPARRGRGAARRREHPVAEVRTSTCCARASAWCSRSRRRSRCRSTTTSPSASGLYERLAEVRDGRTRRGGPAPRRAVGRGQGQARTPAASACPAASSSGCASPARSRSSRK